MLWFSPTARRQDHRDPTKVRITRKSFIISNARARRHDMRIGIATDHGGFSLKEELLGQLRAAGHEVVDFGAHRLSEGDDYPDYVVPARTGRSCAGGGAWSGDLRQRRWRGG